MKAKTREILRDLKESNQCWEWYPTTREIISLVKSDMRYPMCGSVLDIGAGDGRVLKALGDVDFHAPKLFAIEKSVRLLKEMDPNIFVIGTDFHQQTLIDKQVDVIFCNPPYSEFRVWAEKIVKEANASVIYLVIPDRWKKDSDLVSLLDSRGAHWKVLGSFDFLNADRQARAKVDVVKIKMSCNMGQGSDTDPFRTWFDSTFIKEAEEVEEPKTVKKSFTERMEMVQGRNFIETMAELYNQDLDKLVGSYKKLAEIDPALIREFVNLEQLKEGLRMKIKGLKKTYWHELFDKMGTLTDRLTKASREKLLGPLMENTSVDFTSSNAYAVVIWAISNSNKYMDEQLQYMYKMISNPKNVTNYKSNTHFIEDEWRYSQGEATHYKLDYRLIHEFYADNFGPGLYSYEQRGGIRLQAHDLICDMITIGHNLGFQVECDYKDREWEAGKRQEFYCKNGKLFCDVKAYKKGTIHFRFDPDFMKKFNIEAARLNGWIKSPQEASEEMGINITEAEEHFGTSFQIELSPVKLLGDTK